MLRKMFIQAFIAAALIAGGAGLYAASAVEAPPAPPEKSAEPDSAGPGNGYLAPERAKAGKRQGKSDTHHERERAVRDDRKESHDKGHGDD